MVTTTQTRHSWLNLAALLLVFPAAYVIIISLLKYGLGIPGPFDTSTPLLEKLGIKEPVGFNINLIILLGPVAAIILTLIQVVHIQLQNSRDQSFFHITLTKKWFPIAIGLLAALVIGTLFIYMMGENCSC